MTIQPKIKNAYENIVNACNSRLQELYPQGIPEFVSNRYKKELEYIQSSKFLDDFELLRLFYNEARKSSQPIMLRSTLTSSYVVFLLSQSLLNPLPAHYYCPNCGHFEIIKTKLFGMDIPDEFCPHCNSSMHADGFNLYAEFAGGLQGRRELSFDYNVPAEFYPFAKRILQETYPNNVIAPIGISERLPDTKIAVFPAGFIILPEGATIEDYPEMISYLEDGELCVSGDWREMRLNFHRILMFHDLNLDKLLQLQRKTGVYANEITAKKLCNLNWKDIVNTTMLNTASSHMFQTLKPKNYYDMVCLEAAGHNTYTNDDYSPHREYPYDTYKAFENPAFQKYPCYTRDDFCDTLVDLGYPWEKAFEIAECIKFGKQNSTAQKNIDLFASLQLPEGFLEVAKIYQYLFPRSHCIEYTLTFAKIAYYSKINSRIFSKIIYNSK